MTEIKAFSAEIHEDAYSVIAERGEDGKVRISWRRYDGSIRVDTSIRMSIEGAMGTRDALIRLFDAIEGDAQ